MDILLQEPSGNVVENPELRYLESVVLDRGDEYWSSGSGDAGLYNQKGSVGPGLVLLLNVEEGFVLMWRDQESESFLVSTKQVPGTAEVYPGGEPWTLPRRSFVPRDVTLQVVKEFLSTGGRGAAPAGYVWLSGGEVQAAEEA